jgi:hypothetical protein
VEVSHGPYSVDHNIFGSKYVLDNHAQGGAYVNNLFAGKIILKKMLNRATPYHAPHSTDTAGYAFVYGGDDRFFGNIFIGGKTPDVVGTAMYKGCPVSLEEYIKLVDNLDMKSDLEVFEKVEQPAYIADNVYLNGAVSFDKETSKTSRGDFDSKFKIDAAGKEVYLELDLPPEFASNCAVHGTCSLGRVRIVDADFENPDGSPIALNTDYADKPAGNPGDKTTPGPIISLKPGNNRVKIWG